MKRILFILSLFITTVSFAQLENANWCFKSYARVDFNTTPPTAMHCSLDGGGSASYGGNSMSVSNANGQLLFYSDGIEVYDRNGNLMPHGANIGGGAENPLVQTAVIVPKPNNPNLYYIFLVNMITGSSIPTIQHMGLHYVMVDMTKNGGMGDIVYDANGAFIKTALKNQNGDLIDYDYATTTGLRITESRISSTPNADGSKIWLSFFTRFDGVSGLPERWALQYLISENGINNTADGTPASPNSSYYLGDANFPAPSGLYFEGSMKFSPDGKYLCDANTGNVTLYQFDNRDAYGTFTFDRNLYPYTSPATVAGLGVEFSHDSKVLYFATRDQQIYQDGLVPSPQPSGQKYISIRQIGFLTDDTIKVIGKFDIPPATGSPSTSPFPTSGVYHSLQLAIDHKIYACGYSNTQPLHGKLGVINKPWILGAGPTGCDFSPDGITLYPGASHEFSLPQWVHTTSKWPKVYEGKAPTRFNIDQVGNLFTFFHEFNYTTPPVNHVGTYPTSPNTGEILMHYTQAGVTNWWKDALYYSSTLNSGITQLYNVTWPSYSFVNQYIDGTTGNIVSGPSNIPSNEIIIAESNNGDFITRDFNYNSFIHNASGDFPVNIGFYDKAIFNKNTNKLFTIYYLNNSTGILKVFPLVGNSFGVPITVTFQNPNTSIAQIDDLNQVYVIRNGVLERFDYVNNIYVPVSILGFNNTNLRQVISDNPYTENRILFFHQGENKFYIYDLSNLTLKKISTNIPNDYFWHRYVFKDNYLFIAGVAHGNPITIGSQTISPLAPWFHSIFITKFNINVDFSSRPSELMQTKSAESKPAFNVNLSPNPASNLLRIDIAEKQAKIKSTYTILITDHQGNIWLKKDSYISGSSININGLKAGAYFVECMNAKGEKVVQNLVKLQ